MRAVTPPSSPTRRWRPDSCWPASLPRNDRTAMGTPPFGGVPGSAIPRIPTPLLADLLSRGSTGARSRRRSRDPPPLARRSPRRRRHRSSIRRRVAFRDHRSRRLHRPRAVINARALVETGTIVNSAVVEHDAWVGAFAHVAPAAVLLGGARSAPTRWSGRRPSSCPRSRSVPDRRSPPAPSPPSRSTVAIGVRRPRRSGLPSPGKRGLITRAGATRDQSRRRDDQQHHQHPGQQEHRHRVMRSRRPASSPTTIARTEEEVLIVCSHG